MKEYMIGETPSTYGWIECLAVKPEGKRSFESPGR
jgi:hypothetical protein